MRYPYLPAALAGLLLVGCSRPIQNEAAVRQGVIDHLSARQDLNLSQMQIDVTSISFRQNEADVTVSFRPKGGDASSGMRMQYTLERKGNRWAVKGRGAGPHGQMPAAMPGGQMPAGHPPMGPGARAETGK
ncbi:MAG: hypothetical protein ABSE56_09195 [Bryobacteraceae bacterium]